MFTHKDYLEKRCTHREYYAQFVNEGTRQRVLHCIGLDALLNSKDPHFNDIPLRKWDAMVPMLPGSGKVKETGDDYYTINAGVCMAKEAARQIVESHKGARDEN